MSDFIKTLKIICKKMNLNKEEENFAAEIEENIKKASFESWKLILDSSVPMTSINQIRQIQLFCLIKNVFKFNIPTEFQIAEIFHCPPTSAKTLLRNVVAIFSEELKIALYEEIRRIFETLKSTTDYNKKREFKIKINSFYIVEKINEEIHLELPDSAPIKSKGTNDSYYTVTKTVVEYFMTKVEAQNK